MNKKAVDVNLAVYMERLDTYIETQEKLNITLCQGLERVHDELDELKHWRTRFYGAKSLAMLAGILFGHAAVVMATVAGLITLYRD